MFNISVVSFFRF